jgi:hypothetical protein
MIDEQSMLAVLPEMQAFHVSTRRWHQPGMKG